MTDEWASLWDALGDTGITGLHVARRLVKESIVASDPGAEGLTDLLVAVDALDLVLSGVGALQPRETSLMDEIRRVTLAGYDMEAAAEAATALMEGPPGFHALEVGMVVCYARPYTRSYWTARFGSGWLPDDEGDRKLHRELIRLRNKWAAHTDQESGRDVVDTGELLSDGKPLFAATWPNGIRPEFYPEILRLCEAQRERFRAERQRLELQLD